MAEKPGASRRSEDSRVATLRAAWELCSERPYASVTIEAIAARAGVGKPTIYRRWPSKGAVVLDAMVEVIGPDIAYQQTEDDLGDLRTWMHRVAVMLADPLRGGVIRGLVGSAQHDPALMQLWNERIYLPTRTQTVSRIERAQHNGRLSAHDPEILADLLFAPLWFKLLLAGGTPTVEHADAILAAACRITDPPLHGE